MVDISRQMRETNLKLKEIDPIDISFGDQTKELMLSPKVTVRKNKQ
jgi:hypothetical protein